MEPSTPKVKTLKTKHLVLISVLASLMFGISVSAMIWGPSAREQDFITLGRLMESQAYEHKEADEKRAQIDVLAEGIMTNQRNYDSFEKQIQALQAELFQQNLSQSSKTGSPVLENILFTSYNPEAGQTDSTPCIAGGTGLNLCDLAKGGDRPIALSQELIQWSSIGANGPFKAGDHIILESTDHPDDWRCNGEFIVADAMNIRFRSRGDIFFQDRAQNLSCTANVYRVL